ncbi:beta-galactosidase/beta-glucuronidase [Alistipes sp. CAG:268]|jgi:beta-galactosidase/beta-glucuronidase|uniref:glycoside hydrolase family 2 protein n=1 Tax=Alistipes sp. CAG:268 TaxID=1262693 RepID=UPI0003354560|nr:sugar-binding domain-containing protein [Alistipes sp. CAG:268]CDC97798.1 beta-galactosidase/beta-glucuronidase [Alistipes sp. CAG:268]HIX97493.1 beta-galactosidase [Candidatus Alistipes avistercoris]
MKKTLILTAAALLTTLGGMAQWQPAGDRIRTAWSEEIDPQNVLPEYPRPQMVRSEWKNLNGLWNYAIRPLGEQPAAFDGEILVPFAVESSLSGVGERLGSKNELWYERTFEISPKWNGKRILLHFGAVDWKADVWVNGISVGSHTGGYTPFSFDITAALAKGENTLRVRVWDPTDEGYQPRGKQVNNPNGIWYTPVSGIWQTVWLEAVPQQYIREVRTTPDLDRKTFRVEVPVCNAQPGDLVEVTLYDGGAEVASARALNGATVELTLADPKCWSPDSPFLYDMKVALLRNGRRIDAVESYAAMRKFSTLRDKNGIVRLALNNKPLFQFGPLDQGWWPDGLYTAPTDEALAFDVIKTKELGYNMIRKHVKVEPARWYYHCDKAGMIVWQDMPNGDQGPQWQMHSYFTGEERHRSAESEACYRKEWKEIIDYLYSFPSIGVWVPFNEAWGQFKGPEIAEWTKAYDPSRLVNPASGGNHYLTGDILDLHHYPQPKMTLLDTNRATVLGEYGGIGLVIPDHVWVKNRDNWGYTRFNSPKEVTDEYARYADELLRLIGCGFAAAVYTQTTDVEVEVNGLMTYDRKVVKVEEERIREINRTICNSLNEQ